MSRSYFVAGVPQLSAFRRDLASALAEARHAWDYDRQQWPRRKHEARQCRGRLDAAEIAASMPPRERALLKPSDLDEAAQEMAADLPEDWPRYEP